MRDYIMMLLLGGAFFAAVVMLLSLNPKYMQRTTICAGVSAAFLGLLLYGYGYIMTSDSALLAVIQAVFSVCRMFIGDSDFSEICEVGLLQLEWVKILFWTIHVLAFYTTVSAAVSVLGAEALQRVRLWLARYGEISIIYGVNPDSLDFGRELVQREKGTVIYVDENPDPAMAYALKEDSFLLRSDTGAAKGTVKFLKSIGVNRKKQKVTLFALSKDCADNLRYAKSVLESLEQCQVPPENTNLTIHAGENMPVSTLQYGQDKYGYGFVTAFQEQGLVARLLVQNYPPCDYVSFDESGRATEDFHVLMIGFGRMGQVVLRQLVMNGQFVGSRFRAAVFSPDCNETNGFFANSFRGVLDHYEISFHPHDGQSKQLYAYLSAHRDTIKYIVINAGQEKKNREIAEEITQYLGNTDHRIPVFQCSYQGIRLYSESAPDAVNCRVYSPDVLWMRDLDKLAMVINQYYQGEYSRGALQDWMNCDYFSRMSCRASADYMKAILRASGRTEEQAVSGDWNLPEELLETLSKMEHMRWCAFHYCMGFMPMSPEEYAARAECYLDQVARNQKPTIRIGKNMQNKTHACLVGWEGLDDLSAREFAVTQKAVNYKQLDTENILLVPKLLSIKNSLQ